MGKSGPDATAAQQERVIDAFLVYASAQSELGREFAKARQMHTTDSAAIVAIINAEDRGAPLTPARLAERVGLTSGATSILVNRLETAGHIVRRRGYADRRIVTLHSTASIHEAADAFFAPLRVEFTRMMNRYSPAQLQLVEAFATDLRKTVDDYLAAADAGGADRRHRTRS